MASVNPLSRELVFKIVYYGPGLCGKTTTLEHLHATAKPEHRGKLVSLATPVDRTLYFDFLPLRIPTLHEMSVRLQLFTVPGQVYFNATRKLVLTGVDGVVFVSDSQSARADANVESLENLRENLLGQGRALSELPLVYQHNKRDLPEILSMAELDAMLNPLGAPSIGTSASTGVGVYEALQAITEGVLAAFERDVPNVADPGINADLVAIEGGLAHALRAAVSPTPHPASQRVPPPSHVALSEHPPVRGPRSRDTDHESLAHGVDSPTVGGCSFAELWPERERALARQVEQALARGRHAEAIELCEALVSRIFASAASAFGSAEAPREPAVAAMLLGLDGRRHLSFRAVVRDARAGSAPTAQAALAAYAFTIDARLARNLV
jgi:signal recognition particle receptor subunit beta